MNRIFIATIFIFIVFVNLALGAGETLKMQWMGIGARTLAMGNTGTAIIGLPYASFYNPASVSARGKFSMAGGNQFLALDRKLYFASLASEISGGAGIGITWVHSSVADVEARDIDGELFGTIDNGDDAIFFAFAKEFFKKLHIGAGIEYIQRSIENVSTSTAGFGIGMSYRLESPQITIGASAQNLLMKLSWNSNDYYGTGQISNEDLPIVLRAGASFLSNLNDIPLHICADVWNGEDDVHYGLGVETTIFSQPHSSPGDDEDGGKNIPALILRGGIADGRFSGGAGIFFKVSKILSIGVDYAIVKEKEDLTPRHIIDLSFDRL
ncbi:hypothetical protein DRQ26_06855 [bacterium]|nr:MAG: hypothetical protein DRQ26_06855 [bacterium]